MHRVQGGEASVPEWQGMPPALFFSVRVLHDVFGAYYSHPTAWNEIGYGGPASPRGYLRLGINRRDSWEAEERPNEVLRAAAAQRELAAK